MSAIIIGVCLCAISILCSTASADTAFTYQGELKDGGVLANGLYNLDFSLWDAASGGSQIGSTVMFNGLAIIDGRFTVELDFGAQAFGDADLWLEVSVDGNELSPRTLLTGAPFAIQTRGIHVDQNEFIGIGTTAPATALHVLGAGPSVRVENDDGSGSYTLLRDFDVFTTLIEKNTPNGSAGIRISPKPLNGISTATVGLFRQTNTTGVKRMLIHRGDGTSSASAAIGADGADSYFQAHGGNLGIGTTTPQTTLDVAGDSIFRNRLGVGNPSAFFGQLSIVDSGDGSIFAIDANSSNLDFPTIFASNNGGGPVIWAQGVNDAQTSGGGLIVAGDESGENIAIDQDEIMARNDGQPSSLFINIGGGDINLGPHWIHPARAYVRVNQNGAILSQSQNILGVAKTAVGDYEISIEGGTLASDVMIASGEALCVVYRTINDVVKVETGNFDGAAIDAGFSLVVYRP